MSEMKVCPSCHMPYLSAQVITSVSTDAGDWQVDYQFADDITEVLQSHNTLIECENDDCDWSGPYNQLTTVPASMDGSQYDNKESMVQPILPEYSAAPLAQGDIDVRIGTMLVIDDDSGAVIATTTIRCLVDGTEQRMPVYITLYPNQHMKAWPRVSLLHLAAANRLVIHNTATTEPTAVDEEYIADTE